MPQDPSRDDRLYRRFFEQANDLLLLHDLSSLDRIGPFVDANDKACEVLGYTRDELLGLTPMDLIDPPAPDDVDADRDTLLTTGALLFDTELIAKDGRRIPVEMHARLFEHNGRRMVLTLARDITHRLQAETRFRLAASVASDLVYEWDVGDDTLVWYGDVDTALGFPVGELGGDIASWVERIHPEDRPRLEGAVEHHRTSTEPIHYEYRIQTKNGDWRVWSDRAAPVLDPAGKPVRWVGVCSDITERTEARAKLEYLVAERTAELHKAHQRFKLAAELATDIIYEWAPGADRIQWFGHIDEILGYEPGELDRSTESWMESIHPDDRARLRESLDRHQRAGTPYQGEYRIRRKDGSWSIWHDKGVPVTNDEGVIVKWIGACTDITARKAAESRLIKSEQKYRGIFDESIATVYVFDNEKNFIDTNQAGLDLLGFSREELLSMCIPDVDADPEIVLPAHAQLQGGKRLINYEHRLKRADGRIITVLNNSRPIQDADGTVVGMQSTLLDITERKRAEQERNELQQQLVQSQKMEAIGTLAGGIAHDFNNIIATISGTAEVLLRKLPSDAIEVPRLRRILSSSLRAKDLTWKLLTFARREKLNIAQVDVNDVARAVLDMLEGTISKRITVRSELARGLGHVTVDENQIVQALLNICINAADAMPRGGELRLTTSRQTNVRAVADGAPSATESHCVITIADTGAGIDPALQPKIFEPFFTTKERGKGSGLGLSVSHGIIEAHGGFVRVQSEPGQGTTFQVFLPLSDGLDAGLERPEESRTPAPCEGRILVIDDDREFVEMVQEALSLYGFDVETALSGQEGIALFQQHHEAIDAVVLDMILPGMDGTTIYRALMEIASDVPVVLCSGYSIEGDASELLSQGASAYVQKPFGVDEFSKLLSRVITQDGQHKHLE